MPRPYHAAEAADQHPAALARDWVARAGAGAPDALAETLAAVRARYRLPAAALGSVLPPATPPVAAFCARWSLSPALVWALVVDAAKLGLGFGFRFPGQGRARALGPLSFENEPGYLRAMLAAFARMLAAPDAPLTPARYRAHHDACVEGVLHPDGAPFAAGFARRPWRCGFMWDVEGERPGFPAMSRAAWAELLGERLVWVPRPSFVDRAVRDLVPARGRPERCLVRLGWSPRRGTYFLAPTFRARDAAALARELPRRLGRVIARGRAELAAAACVADVAARRRAELAAAARLCRALEMGHFFPDANARTACVVVLHQLLVARGYGPVVLDAPFTMDGYYGTGEMVERLERGFENLRRVRAAFPRGDVA